MTKKVKLNVVLEVVDDQADLLLILLEDWFANGLFIEDLKEYEGTWLTSMAEFNDKAAELREDYDGMDFNVWSHTSEIAK